MKHGSTILTALFGMVVLPAAAQTPELDELGKVVASDRLCTAGFNPVYGWFQNNGRLGVQEVPGLQASVCGRATTGNLRVRLGGLDLPLATEDVRYSLSGNAITMSLLEPVLCEDYYSGNGDASWVLSLLDANGDPGNSVTGLASMSYAVGSGLFTPLMVADYGNMAWLRCHSGLEANFQIVEDGEDVLFSDGFEPNLPQLRVQILDASNQPVEHLAHTAANPARYKVRISNVGGGAANDVRIREFVPTRASLLMPLVTRVSCVPQAGVSGVTLGQACGGAEGEKTLLARLSRLNPGAAMEFDLVRRSTASSSEVAEALVQYAVFSRPDDGIETEYRDNSRSARIKVVDNAAPVITCQGLVAGGTVNLMENQAAETYQCSVTDSEGDAITDITAQSSDTALLEVDVNRSGPSEFILTLTPQAQAHGGPISVTLKAAAAPVDGTMSFNVQIAEFNDPPTFDLGGENILLMPNASVGTLMSPQHYNGTFYQNVNKGSNCDETSSNRCDLTFLSFITNASPGPGEGNQTINPPTVSCNLSNEGRAVRMFATFPSLSPRAGAQGAYNLSLTQYKHENTNIPNIEVVCAIRMTDSDGASMQKNVFFKYKQP